MSGLFGAKVKSDSKVPQYFEDGLNAINHSAINIVDDIYVDDHIVASRVHKSIIGDKKSPIQHEEVLCWTDGEAYNLEQFKDEKQEGFLNLSSLLINLYLSGKLQTDLSKVNGYFSAVLYDLKSKEILLLSDRHGLKFLYYYFDGENFAWSSEIKAFLKLPFFTDDIDLPSLNCFVDLGYIVGNGTWFKNVSLQRPATIVKFNIQQKVLREQCYWSWGNINASSISFDKSKSELANQFVKAVKRRYNAEDPIVVPLSGGLDSRSILGVLNGQQVPTYTFGTAGSEDVVIAKQVAKRQNVDHKFFELSKENYFLGKISGIWKSDGLFNMKHMHYSPFHHDISQLGSILLNGFLGGEIMAANYVVPGHNNKRIDEKTAFALYGEHCELDDYSNSYYDGQHMDVYQLNNRGRRWVVPSTVESSSLVEHRKPFFDYELIDFAYSLPDEYRENSAIYNAMILEAMPELFRNIPWQKKGVPLLGSLKPYYKTKRLAKRVFLKMGFRMFSVAYVDYVNWFKFEPIMNLFNKLIESKDSIYSQYIDSKVVIEKWNLFKNGEIKSNFKGKTIYIEELISRIITIEIYFQQIFNNKYLKDFGYQTDKYDD